MPTPLQNIRLAITPTTPSDHAPRWEDVRAELLAATATLLTPEVERLLLAVLRFDGELTLDETSEMPHRMSPEDMLKSLAVQALGKWTGPTYLPTMRRLQATAPPALSCVIRGVIKQLSTQRGRPHLAEAVAELHAEEPAHTLRINVVGGAGPEVTERELGDRIHYEALPVVQAFGMTFIPAPLSHRWDAKQEA